MTARILPHNIEAEKSVIGGILLHSRALQDVADLLAEEDFYHPVHAAIFSSMLQLDREGHPIDHLAIAEQMRRSETITKLRAQGGEAYFGELMEAVVTVENIRHYARIVANKARARRLAEGLGSVAAMAYHDGDPDEMAAEAEKCLVECARRRGSNVHSYAKIVGEGWREIERRYDVHQATGEPAIGIPTGWPDIDEVTSGWQAGDLDIVAARPSMGKTSFALQTIEHAAERGSPGLFFSLEMTRQKLILRSFASEARVMGHSLRTGQLGGGEWIQLTGARSRLERLNIHVVDETMSLQGIRSVARRWRANPAQGGKLDASGDLPVGVIVVDYLQLVGSGGGQRRNDQNREQEVAEISRGLKALAKELGCAVIALSQLNRGVESRADKRPGLGDLRESGAIEQDADLVAFIYRDEVYNKDSPDKGTAEIILGKQRDGATGMVRLAFLGQYTRFESLNQRPQSPPPYRSFYERGGDE